MNGFVEPEPSGWREHALAELNADIGPGDPSAGLLADLWCRWRIEAQSEGVLCGAGIAAWVMQGEGAEPTARDAETIAPGTVVLQGEGSAREVVSKERTALNYLMFLSGAATLTRRFVQAVSHTPCRILDTRKTAPGMRLLQKYAVRCGGGHNHRTALYDGVMVKDNHIAVAGSVDAAVRKARTARHLLRVEVECSTPEMAHQAFRAGADVLLLDNMALADMRSVVQDLGGKVQLEASGGVNLDTVAAIAETGVDFVSVGALTHSASALPFHLEVE
ncbi:MAG: carboxylating nicotinate-nucleotide diphosphorylase [Fimbriimonadaceae bacterium]